MSAKTETSPLTRREREVMDIVYALGRASVADVQRELPGKPTYSATRMLLQRLQKKGFVRYQMEGARYIYSPATPRASAARAAWLRLVRTFFGGSTASAFSSLLGGASEKLTDEELDELERLVTEEKAKRK